MTHPSKAKGNTFERELVDIAKAHGVPAQRAWGSNGLALGCHPEVDCLVGGYKIQAKRRKKIADYLLPSKHVDTVATRENNGEALIVVPYIDWLELIKKIKEIS